MKYFLIISFVRGSIRPRMALNFLKRPQEASVELKRSNYIIRLFSGLWYLIIESIRKPFSFTVAWITVVYLVIINVKNYDSNRTTTDLRSEEMDDSSLPCLAMVFWYIYDLYLIPGQPKKVSFFVKRDRTLRFFVMCKDTYKVSKSSRSDF